MEDALAVQVLQPPGDVQSQAEPHAPRQVHLAAQQLLQVPAIDVLMGTNTDRGQHVWIPPLHSFNMKGAS